MILFNIIQGDEKKADEMPSFLIQKAYALQTHIGVNTLLTIDSKKKTIRLFFITKILLYSNIEKELKDRFFSGDTIIYATPIIYINEEYGEYLRNKIKSV